MDSDYLKESNELLRSAYAIARRKGVATNWEAFESSLEEVLRAYNLAINGSDSLSASTCTARIYKLDSNNDLLTEAEQRWLNNLRETEGPNSSTLALIDNLILHLSDKQRLRLVK